MLAVTQKPWLLPETQKPEGCSTLTQKPELDRMTQEPEKVRSVRCETEVQECRE